MFGSVDIDINQAWENCSDFDITSPIAGYVFNQEDFVPVEITETGTTAIDSISFFIDNILYQTATYPTTCNLLMSILENGFHKLTVVAFAENKKMRVKTMDFEIARGTVLYAGDFDEGSPLLWELISSNTDYTWQIRENSLESFSETNSNSTASITCPVAYANVNEVIISTDISLPGVNVTEWIFYVGFCDRYPSYPSIVAAISTDLGQTWSDVWQTSSTIEEWTWKKISIDITEYGDGPFQMKFTCSGFSYADVSIDGIRIILSPEVSAENELVSPKMTLTNYPNPFNPSTTISLNSNTEATENAELVIYNLKGQIVKSFASSSYHSSGAGHRSEFIEGREANQFRVVWNGTDDSGKPISSGIYFAKLKNANQQVSRKMLLLK